MDSKGTNSGPGKLAKSNRQFCLSFHNIVDPTELHRFVIYSINHGFGPNNLAASGPMYLRELVDLMFSLSGSSSKIFEHESTKQSFSNSREKIEQELGCKPTATEDTVRRYVIHNLRSRVHLKRNPLYLPNVLRTGLNDCRLS